MTSEQTAPCAHEWKYTGTDYHGSYKGEDCYECACGAWQYRLGGCVTMTVEPSRRKELKMTKPQDDLVEGLASHFPTGLRSTRGYLPHTSEVFEGPIQCECYCGEGFAGSDEQEVRQLWAEHCAALSQQDAMREALELAKERFEFYEQCHRLKSTSEGDEKADRNRELADKMGQALARTGDA